MKLNRENYTGWRKRPERVVQFGEGNFLRAFADWIICRMNAQGLFDGSVVVVKPRPGSLQPLIDQDCLYHVILQGLKDGKPVQTVEVVDSISRCVNPYDDFDAYMQLAENPDWRFVISNTTEAGIVFDPDCRLTDRPATSFPGKLTQLLYHRYEIGGDGIVMLPCELIFDNGKVLKECVLKYADLWELGDGFKAWLDQDCEFHNTLVDRIVPGKPKDSINLEYDDAMAVVGELFHLWVIETPDGLPIEGLSVDRAGLNVKYAKDEHPYHSMKVGLLNAPHTAMSPVGLLSGMETVGETLNDPLTGRYVRHLIYDELIGTIDLPIDELQAFADDVVNRFRNPYVRHELRSIMLNAEAKYVARDLPAVKRYVQQHGSLPKGLVFGLSALLCHNHPQKPVKEVLADTSLWGTDLTQVPGLTDLTQQYCDAITSQGIRPALEQIL